MFKSALFALGKILLLAFVAMVLNVAADQVVPLSPALQPAPEELQTTALMALVVQVVYAALFYAAAVQSDLAGWRLYLALFCIYFGLNIVMAQIEAIIFIDALAPLTLPDIVQIVIRSLVTIVPYVAVVLLLAGRWRGGRAADPRPTGEILNRDLIWKIALLAALYPFIYFGAGRLIAWQFEAVRTYYTTTTTIIYDQVTLASIQVLRGAAWVLFGLPIFLMFRSNARAVTYSALFYGLLSSIVLIIPNPFMPAPVRYPHLIELGSSMILFGLLVGGVMVGWQRHRSSTPHSALPGAA